MKNLRTILCSVLVTLAASAHAQPAPLAALPTLDIPSYMGTWYQVAWFPNRFQKQCVADTSATYRRIPDGVDPKSAATHCSQRNWK